MFSRGGAEEAAGRDQCGLPAAGAGEGAQQEDRPGAEDERGAQDQVRRRAEPRDGGRAAAVDEGEMCEMGNNHEGMTGSCDTSLCNISSQ